jgi:hypothetical protein
LLIANFSKAAKTIAAENEATIRQGISPESDRDLRFSWFPGWWSLVSMRQFYPAEQLKGSLHRQLAEEPDFHGSPVLGVCESGESTSTPALPFCRRDERSIDT